MAADLQNANYNWIYQSNKLIEASHSFTVLEQKLVRLLASMIKKDDIEFKQYKFKAMDLSRIVGIQQKNIYKSLDKITDKLMSRVITIRNDKEQKFKKFHLIKTAEFENGILTMEIDVKMKEFYLQLKQYTKYQLKNIMQFKNIYSFRLYELLKQYEKIGNRIITINDLRTALDIGVKKYAIYSNLKQKVINIIKKEINENTDIYFEYEEIKTNRKVTGIKFYIKANKTKNKAIEEGCSTLEDKSTNKEEKSSTELINTVKSIFKENITGKEAKFILNTAKDDINIIKEKYDIVSQMKKVGSVVATMIDAIRKDYQAPKGKKNGGSFNDYEQRDYDFNDLERKLLGWDKEETVKETGEEFQQLSMK
ncbi:replication initiation protein [Clostridium algoriphilum]|uniref:replication initiation protein n=1 Tax=Clostridium algoriphilum TaxID=198347 RepID=UPI001CF42D3D|nr:replication initiation protein [Clostridium algoriphilum]MCB2295785.1 replication initiation protein [Clostridium algoriphilum]